MITSNLLLTSLHALAAAVPAGAAPKDKQTNNSAIVFMVPMSTG